MALGYKLFHDVRLSTDNTVSCASCHSLEKAGTDNLATSTGVRGQKGGITAPTVFNAAFHTKQFWDGRAASLQEQAGGHRVCRGIQEGLSPGLQRRNHHKRHRGI